MVGVAFIDCDLMQDACNKVAIVAVFQLMLARNGIGNSLLQQTLSNPRGPGGLYVCLLLSVIMYNILLGNNKLIFLRIRRANECFY